MMRAQHNIRKVPTFTILHLILMLINIKENFHKE